MKPINKYLVITPIEEQLTSASGLLLSAEDAKSFRYKKALVIEPGTEVSAIKRGDVIYFVRNAGLYMMIMDETYTIIIERDVVVVV